MPFWVVPAAIAAGQLIGGLISQGRQNRANRKIAREQQAANERLLQEQLEYNTPKNQMARFQEGGLNPNLVYGQGNPGNQAAPLTHPDIGRTDYQSLFSSITPAFNQSLMTQSQVQAIDAKTRQTYVMTQLNKLQARVLARNPLLDSEGFNAIMQSLKSAAEIKASEAHIMDTRSVGMNQVLPSGWKVGEQMVMKELELLEQKFRLQSLDESIKAQVLQSKEFQNAILEVQQKWMTDAEVTPQHILQFIQLLLMKIL